MDIRLPRLVLAMLAGVLIGVALEAIVGRAVPAHAWRALVYAVLTAVVFVLVIRTAARGRW